MTSNERRPGNVEMPWSSVYELLWSLHGQRRRWPVDLPVGPNSVFSNRWTYLGVGQSRVFVGVNVTKVSLEYHVSIFYNGRNADARAPLRIQDLQVLASQWRNCCSVNITLNKHPDLKQDKPTRRRSHWRSLDISTVCIKRATGWGRKIGGVVQLYRWL